jgi:hypothetical protein
MFDNLGITTNGYTMIAKATTGNKIVLMDARCSQNTISNIANATTNDFLSSPVGIIKSASADMRNARIVVEFSNAGLQTELNLKSFCVRAHTTDAATTNYVFAAASVNSGGISLKPVSQTGGLVVKFQVPFNLTFTGASNYITGLDASSASLSDLDRFVSLHAVGNDQAGDNQTILGEKTFANDIFSAHNASGDSLCNLGNTADRFNAINGNFGNFVFVSAVKPDDPDDPAYGQETRVGADYAPFDHVYGNNLHGVIPSTKLSTSEEIPIGAIVCLNGLAQDLGVGAIVSGSYNLASLAGVTDGQGHTTTSSQEYRLLTSTTSSTRYALAIRIV